MSWFIAAGILRQGALQTGAFDCILDIAVFVRSSGVEQEGK